MQGAASLQDRAILRGWAAQLLTDREVWEKV